MFVQLYHTGRIAHSSLTGDVPVSASAFTPKGRVTTASFTKVDYETPRALDREDFPALIQKFVAAASRAIAAGADGVEIHGANGYLIDQFLRDGTNDRTDEYGGTRVYQARLLTKITQAVASAIGLAYLHIIESFSKDFVAPRACNPISDSMKKAFVGPVILNRAYTAHSATVAIQSGAANGIAFGIPFISNPDLVRRFCEGQEKGYTDYQGALNDPNPDGLPHRARTKTPKS